jgi:hypothetical protein
MKTPHYLRFVQALVLAAAVPACSSGDDPAPPAKGEAPALTGAASGGPAAPESPPSAATSAPPAAPVAETQHPAQPAAHADTGVDAGLPFSSGPIVPPELPASFA